MKIKTREINHPESGYKKKAGKESLIIISIFIWYLLFSLIMISFAIKEWLPFILGILFLYFSIYVTRGKYFIENKYPEISIDETKNIIHHNLFYPQYTEEKRNIQKDIFYRNCKKTLIYFFLIRYAIMSFMIIILTICSIIIFAFLKTFIELSDITFATVFLFFFIFWLFYCIYLTWKKYQNLKKNIYNIHDNLFFLQYTKNKNIRYYWEENNKEWYNYYIW